MKRTQGNIQAARETVLSKVIEPRKVYEMQSTMFLTVQKSKQRSRISETPKGCRGLRAWHVYRESPGTWETQVSSHLLGMPIQPKRRSAKANWESDQFIVLGDGNAVHTSMYSVHRMGKGLTQTCCLYKEHIPNVQVR